MMSCGESPTVDTAVDEGCSRLRLSGGDEKVLGLGGQRVEALEDQSPPLLTKGDSNCRMFGGGEPGPSSQIP
jgi:hypothetical protein